MEPQARRRCEVSGKLCYRGQGEARRAHMHAHYRIRVYRCPDCRTFHVTNQEKDRRRES